jgi:uncharacterized membrane protein
MNQEKGFWAGDGVDKAFKAGLLFKAIHGCLEIIGGILLLVIKPEQIQHFVRWLTQGELADDPHDFIAQYLVTAAHHLTGASLLFGAIYLLSHGIVKLVLVIEVLRDHLWAYIALIAVTALFILYQLYSLIFIKVSAGFILLTIFDVIIIWLTQKEYRRHLDTREKQA